MEGSWTYIRQLEPSMTCRCIKAAKYEYTSRVSACFCRATLITVKGGLETDSWLKCIHLRRLRVLCCVNRPLQRAGWPYRLQSCIISCVYLLKVRWLPVSTLVLEDECPDRSLFGSNTPHLVLVYSRSGACHQWAASRGFRWFHLQINGATVRPLTTSDGLAVFLSSAVEL